VVHAQSIETGKGFSTDLNFLKGKKSRSFFQEERFVVFLCLSSRLNPGTVHKYLSTGISELLI
jgi:hypothetical protein